VTIALESKGVKPQIEKELAPVGEAAEKESKKAGDSLDKIGTKALAAAAIGSAALFGLASAAGGLNAALQTSDRVFGDASDSVKDFAADTSDAVFLSEEAALKAANAFGIFGTQAGMSKSDAADFSLEMVGLASDLAAVADVPIDQAIADLSSAFAGSTETMQKYGINLNETELKATYFAETGERITGVMTSQQKTMAVYWALLDKGSFAFGAAESEAGQFSAQLDRLKSVAGNVASGFGQPILDFATTLISTVSDKAQSVLDFNNATGGMFATGVAASIGIATLVTGVVGAGSKLKSGIDMFKDLATWQKTATLATLGVGAALVAGFTIYGAMTQHQRELEAQTQAAGAALAGATAEAWKYAEATAAASGDANGLAVAQQALGTAVLESFSELDPELLGALGIQANDLGRELIALREDPLSALRRLGEGAGLTGEQAEVLTAVIEKFGSTSDDNATNAQMLGANIFQLGGDFTYTTDEAFALADQLAPVAGNLEDVWDAAQTMDLDDTASKMLNTAYSSNDLAASLIDQADALSEGSRNGEGAYDVYVKLNELMAEMTPAERQAAKEALGLADAHVEAADTGDEMNSVASSTVDLMTDMERAAKDAADQVDAFTSTLDKLINPTLDYNAAERDRIALLEDMADAVKENNEDLEEGATLFDIHTKAGRANQQLIEDNVAALLDSAEAYAEQGHSIEETEAKTQALYQALVGQMVTAFDMTDQEARDYLATLGLTPESITTSVEASHLEETKQDVQGYLDQLENIPEDVATRIQAAIDEGSLAYARTQLQLLTQPRSVTVSTTFRGSPRNAGPQYESAGGNLFTRPAVTSIAEDGTEWVAPLTDPDLMERWLQDPAIRNPVIDGLGLEMVASAPDGGGSSNAPLNFYSLERNPSPSTVAAGIAMRAVGRR